MNDPLKHLKATLLTGSALAALAMGLGHFLKYAMSILFARWMGAAEYGAFSLALTWANILGVVAMLGLGIGALQLIPRYLETRQIHLLKGFLFGSRLMIFGSAFAVSCMAYDSKNEIFPDPRSREAFAIGMYLLLPIAWTNFHLEVLRGMGRIGWACLPWHIGPVGGALLAALLLWQGELDAAAGLYAYGLGLIATLLLHYCGIRQAVHETTTPEDTTTMRFEWMNWLRLGGTMFILQVSQLVVQQSDIAMLGIFVDAQTIGYYTAAAKTALLVGFIPTAIGAIAGGMIGKAYAQRDFKALRQLHRIAIFWALPLSALLASGLYLWGATVLTWFGPDFEQAHGALCWAMLGQLACAACGPVFYLIALTGHERYCARVFVGCALSNIVLNLLLIPWLGMTGAAVASALTNTGWNVLLLHKANSVLKPL